MDKTAANKESTQEVPLNLASVEGPEDLSRVQRDLRRRLARRALSNLLTLFKSRVQAVADRAVEEFKKEVTDFLGHDLIPDMDLVLDAIREEEAAARSEFSKIVSEQKPKQKLEYANDFEKVLLRSILACVSPDRMRAHVDGKLGFQVTEVWRWLKEHGNAYCPHDPSGLSEKIQMDAPNFYYNENSTTVHSKFFKMSLP